MVAFASLLALLLAQGALSLYENHVRMEPTVNQFSSKNWIQEKDLLSPNDEVKAIFVLKKDEIAMKKFEAELLELSTPKSAKYGKWLTKEEVIARTAPKEEKIKIVTDYLASYGLTGDAVRLSAFRDMVFVTMPVKVANILLKTEFAAFRSVQRRSIVLPRITQPYHLPVEVANVVTIVDDILRFPAIRESPRSLGSQSGLKSDPQFSTCGVRCNGFTTPAVLQAAYNFSPVQSVAPGNSMSVAEFQYQYYDTTDLSAFSTACGVTSTVDVTIGGNNPNICTTLGGCVEALLDIEYIEAVANPIPLTVIYSASYSLLNWVNEVIALPNPPLVHSVSYGNDEVQQTSTAYMISVDQQFQQAASLGLSILFASGDQGVWGRSGVGSTFNPDFPAGSPYVTAVGGTNFATAGSIGAESAWSCGGGGFSNTFARPSWQDSAVSSYLASAAGVLPSSSLYNSSGRAYPDIAALGGQTNPYCVAYSGGSFGGVAGTSASAPVVAGIFAQVNNVRLAAGKSSLGWLNPFIYANPQCFNDVTDLSQNNCNAGTTGFSATSGWDAATGFGSPNYACLAAAALSY